MKIALVYTNGQAGGHFGHAEAFKIYEVADGSVVSSAVLQTEGSGHSYMAGLMAENGINLVIASSMGSHARFALEDLGIDYVLGIEGDADEVISAFLSGSLEPTSDGASTEGGCGGCCGESSESEEDCGGCESSGGCGSCGGCGGAPQIILEGKNAGKTVRVHYRGTFNDGTQFDASYDRGEPLEFISGAGMMIPGFDKAVVDMEVGEETDIHLLPEDAYGERNPNAVFTIPIAELPGSEDLTEGMRVHLMNQYGQPIPVLVTAKDDVNITFDANHEMAGKELNFHIELVEVVEN